MPEPTHSELITEAENRWLAELSQDRREEVLRAMRNHGFSVGDAIFFVAITKGEITGDVVEESES